MEMCYALWRFVWLFFYREERAKLQAALDQFHKEQRARRFEEAASGPPLLPNVQRPTPNML